MALVDSESFASSTNIADYLNYSMLGGRLGGSGSWFSIQTGGPFGDNYLKMDDSSTPIALRILQASVSSFFCGMRINLNNDSGFVDGCGMVFQDYNGNTLFSVGFNSSTGAVTVYQGFFSSTVLGQSGGGATPTGGWFYCEVGAVLNASTGSVTVKVNGTAILTLSNVDNQPSGTGACGAYGVGCGECTNFTTTHWYFCDATGSSPWNTFLGDVRVQGLFATSNDSVQFTPIGTSNNWQNISQVPPVPSTDYNQSATVSNQDTFNMGTLSSTLGNVFALHVKVLSEKNDAGQRSIEPVIKSSGTIGTGNAYAQGISTEQSRSMFELDPATGVQWTHSGVNAAKVGYKISA